MVIIYERAVEKNATAKAGYGLGQRICGMKLWSETERYIEKDVFPIWLHTKKYFMICHYSKAAGQMLDGFDTVSLIELHRKQSCLLLKFGNGHIGLLRGILRGKQALFHQVDKHL